MTPSRVTSVKENGRKQSIRRSVKRSEPEVPRRLCAKGETELETASPWMYTLLFFPVYLHLIILSREIVDRHAVKCDWLDLIVLAGLVGYVTIGSIAMRRREWGLRFQLVSFSTAFTVLSADVGLSFLYPSGLPRIPSRHVAVASDAMPGVTGTIRFK